MNMVLREIGGAIQKAGVNIEETARALKIKHLGQRNGDSAETITENLSKAGQEAKERLAAVDQKIAEKNNADRAYKEAYKKAKTGGDDSVVKDAINRDREASQKTPLLTAGDERGNVNLGGGENPGIMYTAPEAPANPVALYDSSYAEHNLKTAQSVVDPEDRSGILDMVKAHPFISAGIAGGVGVLGANLFDDDDE